MKFVRFAVLAVLAAASVIWSAQAAFADPVLTRDQVFSAQSKAMRAAVRTDKAVRLGVYPYWASASMWTTCSANVWVSGYAPGSLWASYQLSGDSSYRSRAIARQRSIWRLQSTSRALDIGQRYYYSVAKAYDLTGKKAYRGYALAAAKLQAARFNSAAGIIRSRNTTATHEVIIDELMNIQLLFWAARNGGSPKYREFARTHARTAARDFVREDGSTYHVVSYDTTTGAVVATATSQGYSADSMWSRGQAWAIYGFANAYKETRDPLFLGTARRVADRYWSELPSDTVPFWDFRDPAIPDAPRDSSAAAIAASGMIMLSLLETDTVRAEEYADRARTSIAALLSPTYQSAHPQIVLKNGTLYYPTPVTRGCALSFGDYFFLEALSRLRLVPTDAPRLPVKRVRASKGAASRATDGSTRTYWSARGKQWIQLDLGTRASVSAVAIAVRDGSSRSAGFSIRVSNDGKHWRTVARPRSSATVASLERYDFRAARGRFVRVECNGSSRSKTLRISDLRVY